MKGIPQTWLWSFFAITILIIGAITEYNASDIGLVSKRVSILQDSQELPISTTKVVQPLSARVLSVIAQACWALGSSILISIFILTSLEERRRKGQEEKLNRQKEEQERYLDKIQKSINEDVFTSLFKRIVPSEIFDIIMSDLIKCKVIRHDANWIYEFKESSSGKIELKQTLQQRLENLTEEPVQDAIQVQWDKEHPSDQGLIKVKCQISDGQLLEFDKFSSAENTGSKVIVEEIGQITKVSVPISIPKKGYADVTMVIKQQYDEHHVYDIFQTRFPIINAKLISFFPESYEFGLFQSLSSKLVPTLCEAGRSIFEAKGAIFPGQGFVYSLKKKVIQAPN